MVNPTGWLPLNNNNYCHCMTYSLISVTVEVLNKGLSVFVCILFDLSLTIKNVVIMLCHFRSWVSLEGRRS